MPKKFSLVAFATAAKIAADKPLPDRLLVVPWGTTTTRKGLVVCNATTLAQLPGNQAREKYDVVAFDFQHNTVKENVPEPKKVAGHGIPEIVDGEGIYLSSIDYTPEGREYLANGHYPDISPAVVRNEAGEVLFLHSVGACRQGEIDGLTLFSASDDIRLSTFAAAEDETDPAETTEPADLRSLLVGLLNAINPEAQLAADATDGDIATAARAVAGKMKPSDEVTAMSARITLLEATVGNTARNAIVTRAVAEGKVIPLSSDQINVLDITVLESLVTGLPVTVPLESRLGGAIDDFKATPGKAITPELREVARQMGLKPEALV